ncbi:dTDP-4-dehydrorhamnose 3,5-epimerase [Membranihabitans marinus]|uniref:dTDP-4-dehydrorhamnose 3,5-epimerase n=1 Tax=Membranihabitans marinus TaxID=1227546 RepID=UPI001F0305BD|nr:dTDP-4-dehydrorhamnose 3,5-epimerase [Membranihabitans marinus]
MKIEQTPLEGLRIIRPRVFKDDRGYFFESYRQDLLHDHGIAVNFVQENQSKSSYGVVRGLHYQRGKDAQGKLVRAVQGKILDVVVDIRPESKTYGQYFSIELDDVEMLQLWVPAGFAHGFSVLSPKAIIQYKCDNYYNPKAEGGIIWNDDDLNIDWKLGAASVSLSDKDKKHPKFAQHTPIGI